MKYVTYLILFGLLGIIYFIYRGISKYLDDASKILLTVLPVTFILGVLTNNIPYNSLLVVAIDVIIMVSVLDKEDEEAE